MISLDGPHNLPAALSSSSSAGREGLSFMSSSTAATPSYSSNENSAGLAGGSFGSYVPPSLMSPSSPSSADTFVQRWFAGAKHPTVCFFHLFFKAASLAVYVHSRSVLRRSLHTSFLLFHNRGHQSVQPASRVSWGAIPRCFLDRAHLFLRQSVGSHGSGSSLRASLPVSVLLPCVL